MSIRMGIYDFFAYTIPGGLCLLAVLYAITIFTPLRIDLMQVSIAQVLIFAVASYVVGILVDPLAKFLRFRSKDVLSEVRTEVKRRNTQIDLLEVDLDWYVLLAYIRYQSMDMATEVERFKATEIMTRNVSFVLLIYAVLAVVNLMVNGYSIWPVVLALLSLPGFILARKQALRYRKWFFQAIYGTVAAFQLRPEDIPIQFGSPKGSLENEPKLVKQRER